jgi:hypothetical protein
MDKAHHGLQLRMIFEQAMLIYLHLLWICSQLQIKIPLSFTPCLKTHTNSNFSNLLMRLVYAKVANPKGEPSGARYGSLKSQSFNLNLYFDK